MIKKAGIILVACVLSSIMGYSQVAGKVELMSEKLDRFLNVRDFCISDDHSECYFSVQSSFQEISRIAVMKKKGAEWSEPQLMEFSGTCSDLEPFLSPDQKRLYFVSNRPLKARSDSAKDYDIWYVERKDPSSAWSEPVNMGKPVNSERDEFYPSLSSGNNLYFTSETPEGLGKDDIYLCRWNGTAYEEPVPLTANVNSSGMEFNAFVSRDDHFLFFTKYNSSDGLGSGDLYLSRKDRSGSWGKAENLGKSINTKFMEYCHFYDEREEMLYFTSRRNSLQPQKFKDLEEYDRVIRGSGNGLSKLYKVRFSLR